MWSFDGEYKSKRKQSLSGKSNTLDRQTLLTKLTVDRNLREKGRCREEAAIKIQTWTRGCLCRIRILREQRKSLDNILANASTTGLTQNTAETLIFHLVKIFNVKVDSERLLCVCQHLIKQQNDLNLWISIDFAKWKFLLPRLVRFALLTLSLSSVTSKGQSSYGHGIPLRLLEIIISPKLLDQRLSHKQKQDFLRAFFLYLLRNNYYQHLVKILISKVPEVDEVTQVSPVPLGDSLMNLLLEPVKIYTSTQDASVGAALFSEMCSELFTQAHHSQILNLVLPYFSSTRELNESFMEELINHFYHILKSLLPLKWNSSLLISLLLLNHSPKGFQQRETFVKYLLIIGRLLEHLPTPYKRSESSKWESDSESDSDSNEELVDVATSNSEAVGEKCLDILNSSEFVSWILHYVERYLNYDHVLIPFSKLFHHILSSLKYQLHKCKMLYSVVLRRHILLRPMWRALTTINQGSITAFDSSSSQHVYGTSLLQVLSCGYPLTASERDYLIPLLSTFSATLIAVLSTLHDSEFLGERDYSVESKVNSFPFTVEEVVKMSALLRDVCVGLVDLAHPDVRLSAYIDGTQKVMWENCFKVCVGVVRQIHLRDSRRHFCPDNHWLSSKVFLKDEVSKSLAFRPWARRRNRRLFQPLRFLSKDELEAGGAAFSVTEQRRATLLKEIPFVYPFETRMGIFSTLISRDRNSNQSTAAYGVGPSISISIRRTHLYEDAFDKLSAQNERDLRLKMRIRLMNVTGLDEAGIDGGGIFREFLTELLSTAFDPTRGFFLMTRDNTLYPNPGANLIVDNMESHYFFIGRMLGKALYENLLVEIPMAGFFLSKLLCGSSSVEFHYLDSLDPELCRNLLSLKSYTGDIRELGLDFTVLNSNLGQNTVEDLLPNGSNVAVTNENVIEYIYRMADYKLNKQIARQCQAFKEGVFNVIDARWLRLFNWRELQMLVSGASTPINVEDLKQNTKYSGGYSEEHQTISTFWKVVSNFDESQCRQLLKFVTSCSRPPLLGFKELFPAFCIHPSGSEDRLPTASTCMNLLKLPEYKDCDTLKEKLLYAITSSAGFELS